jgi:hypothetical protein
MIFLIYNFIGVIKRSVCILFIFKRHDSNVSSRTNLSFEFKIDYLYKSWYISSLNLFRNVENVPLFRGYNISSKLSSGRLSLFGWSVNCWMVSALARTLQLFTDRPNNMFCLENKWYHYYKFLTIKWRVYNVNPWQDMP